MKKKILIIGNTDGLPGVTVDIDAYCTFFRSPIGGNWYREEIDQMPNPSLRSLTQKIDDIRRGDYEYVITIFSGHGAEAASGAMLEINHQGESVTVNELRNLSSKQLLIFDCCRMPINNDFIKASSIISFSRVHHDPIREAYEERIRVSSPQEIILFACDKGESAMDTPKGGEYSRHLLDAAQVISKAPNVRFVSVSETHEKVVSLMLQAAPPIRQNPKIIQPRCLSSQRLSFAINANLFS